MCSNRFQKISHLIGFQYSWGTTADKDRFDDTRWGVLNGLLHFSIQSLKIIHHRLILENVGIKITIKALIGTKRNMNVYGLRGTAISIRGH
ncbi:hypothetical protein D3C76_1277550 [compost metagenome]